MVISCNGRIVKNLSDSNLIDLFESEENSPSPLSFSGSVSHPDLLLAHPALPYKVQLKLIDIQGSAGHKFYFLVL
ncbi:hypothetical protein TNCT_411891 [Trichonephila clavata]|uniref:Uncharacterized protein n=1 Tax=Trichonephila clavata TaxID=2740835 RepID=A0A8X6F1U1_TRICU|nr:hypothetical protein TNCT_411891 [Trichonephila clavata]